MLQQPSERSPTPIPHQNENNWNVLLIKPIKFFLFIVFAFILALAGAAVFTFHCAPHHCHDLGQMCMPRTDSSFDVCVTDDESV